MNYPWHGCSYLILLLFLGFWKRSNDGTKTLCWYGSLAPCYNPMKHPDLFCLKKLNLMNYILASEWIKTLKPREPLTSDFLVYLAILLSFLCIREMLYYIKTVQSKICLKVLITINESDFTSTHRNPSATATCSLAKTVMPPSLYNTSPSLLFLRKPASNKNKPLPQTIQNRLN